MIKWSNDFCHLGTIYETVTLLKWYLIILCVLRRFRLSTFEKKQTIFESSRKSKVYI